MDVEAFTEDVSAVAEQEDRNVAAPRIRAAAIFRYRKVFRQNECMYFTSLFFASSMRFAKIFSSVKSR